jgi:Flp pilus assembly protein TadG
LYLFDGGGVFLEREREHTMWQRLYTTLKTKIQHLSTQDGGVVAIISALVFVVLIGFAALAIDASQWYSQKRQLQLAADAGAAGGAIALATTGVSTMASYATNDIQANNCTGANSCTIVAINNPPTSGPAAGNTKAVEVILSKPADVFLSGFFSVAPTITARAVAGAKPANNCIVSLATTGTGLSVTGNGSILSPNCGIAVNSSANNAITASGNGLISAQSITVVGNTNTTGNGTITATNGVTTGAAATTDPYAGVTLPSASGCNQNNFQLSGKSSQTINPGVFCGGIQLSGQSSLIMNPGVYFMDSGSFNVAGGATVTGTGVTIILTSSSGSGYGTVSLSGGSTVTLSSPTTGSTAGLLFVGLQQSANPSIFFTGGSNQVLNGALYFPTSEVHYSGNGAANPCVQIVAKNIIISGNGNVGNNCGSGSSSGTGSIQMLE